MRRPGRNNGRLRSRPEIHDGQRPGQVKSSTAIGIFALAAAYFVAGQLGLLLAIPQGFASPVWPASGIALGSLLVYGNRLWPGVLLGSLFVEWSLHGDLSTFTTDPANLLLPVVIGSGAALQALLGAYLIRRTLGFPVPLDDGRSVGAFLVLGGPLACLFNATVGNSSLWVADRLGPVEIQRELMTAEQA